MQDKNNIPMVSSEIAGLWLNYISDSVASCMLKYFINTVEDADVKPHLQNALSLSQEHIQAIKIFFNNEGLPIPQGFGDNDVNLNAPKLYSDSYMLYYLAVMCRSAMSEYSIAYNNVPRADIRNYFSQCIKSTMNLYEKMCDTMLNMGIFVKAPVVEVPKDVSFINKGSFLSGIIGEPRQLTTIEILHLFNNILTDSMIRTLTTGFAQVASSKQIKEHLFKKVDILTKHLQAFGLTLSNDNIQVPSSSYGGITDSIVSPFSDKLILFQATTILGNMIITNYGAAIGSTLRSDLVINYTRFIADIASEAKSCIDIMIEQQWFEQPPQAVNRKELAGIK